MESVMNETVHPSCPGPDELQPDFNDMNKLVGLFIFIFYAMYFPVTCAWWWSRRHHPWLRKRNFELMLISGIGVWCEIAVAPLGNFTGRPTFPCDAHLWLTFLIIPVAAGPIVARLILIFNSARYNRVLLSEGQIGRALARGKFERQSLSTSLVALAKLMFLRCGNIDALLQSNLDRLGSSVRAMQGKSGEKKASERNLKASSEESSEGDDESLERKNSIVQALHLITRGWFGYLVLLLFLMIALISIAAKYSNDDLPFGKGCLGCHLGVDDIGAMGAMILVTVVAGTWLLYKVRHEPDPLGMIAEIKLLFACGLVVVAGTVLSVIDIGGLRATGTFDWVYICVFASVALHTIHCPLQVWRTYHPLEMPANLEAFTLNSMEDKLAGEAVGPGASGNLQHGEDGASMAASSVVDSTLDAATLDKVLSTRGGRRIFKQYLATEFAVENLYFIDSVERFRSNYSHMAAAEVNSTANDIYRSFVKEGSMLEVNLSAINRRRILGTLGNPAMDVAPVTTFDAAFQEVYGLLVTDSFPRFLRSEFYRQWAMPTLAV